MNFNLDQQATLDAARGVLRDAVATVKGRHALLPRDDKPETIEQARQVRASIIALLQLEIGALPYERAAAVLLDCHSRLIEIKYFPAGDGSSCATDYRLLAGWIIEAGCYELILAHNHPSGECRPSDADKEMTTAMRKWLQAIDVALVDHIVVTGDGHTSILGRF
jgi:DNA repair protein RadC